MVGGAGFEPATTTTSKWLLTIRTSANEMVVGQGFEPWTPCESSKCSPTELSDYEMERVTGIEPAVLSRRLGRPMPHLVASPA